ncbi:MAG: uroporphyrinogen-III C-methyltransferase [Dehalococcoidia bacterium]|nr:uroporphyrinogen-III C-methyltransferase [Dehalococcoidia bacterium]
MNGGRVYLVGAGPGDPELITLKGLRLLRNADVVVHDRLIDMRLLDHCRPDVELMDAGKYPGGRGQTQARISGVLIEKAGEGKRVVRLKGGDPFVFGRGGEEAEALRDAGIPFEVSPGVTSAVAVPAYAGIPLTHRDYASAFTVITGSVAQGRPEMDTDWSAVARMPGTLVILMGWNRAQDIVSALIAAGKPVDTPAAIVSRGATADQKSVSGRLSDVVNAARRAGLEAPAVIVVGEVARLHERLNWYEKLPLFGRRIMVTRSRTQASGLSTRLAELGAYSVDIPTIEIRSLEDFSELDSYLRKLSEFDWVVFTSVNAVLAVCDRLMDTGMDMRAFHPVKVAAVGRATSSELLNRGVRADLMPDRATSNAVAAALARSGVGGKRILLPRADIATNELPDSLRSSGAIVSEVDAYRTVTPNEAQAVKEAIQQGVDAIAFSSSSTVENLLKVLNYDVSLLTDVAVACIGPATAATASSYGLKVDIVSKVAATDSLADAVAECFSGQ